MPFRRCDAAGHSANINDINTVHFFEKSDAILDPALNDFIPAAFPER